MNDNCDDGLKRQREENEELGFFLDLRGTESGRKKKPRIRDEEEKEYEKARNSFSLHLLFFWDFWCFGVGWGKMPAKVLMKLWGGGGGMKSVENVFLNYAGLYILLTLIEYR